MDVVEVVVDVEGSVVVVPGTLVLVPAVGIDVVVGDEVVVGDVVVVGVATLGTAPRACCTGGAGAYVSWSMPLGP